MSQSERERFTAILLARIAVQILDVIGLAAIGFVGAALAGSFESSGSISFLSFTVATPDEEALLIFASITAAFFIVKSGLAAILLRVTTRFLGRFEARCSSEIAGFLFSGGLEKRAKFSSGDSLWVVVRSSHVAFGAMLFSVAALISEGALFAFILIFFVVVDAWTAIFVALYFVLIVMIFQLSVNRRLDGLGKRLSTISVGLTDAIQDLSGVFREVTVLGKKEIFLRNVFLARETFAKDNSTHRFIQGLPRYLVETALMLGLLFLVAWQAFSGSLADGLAVAGVFLAGGVRLMAALLPLQAAVTDLRFNAPQADAALSALEAAKDERRAQGGRPNVPAPKKGPEASPLEVSFQKVVFSHPDSSEPAINDVSFHVRPGEFVALIGPSGAGKSTLADLMLGLRKPQSGTIRLNAQDPETLRLHQPGCVGYVPQSPLLVSGTLLENIALGVREADVDETALKRAIEAAGLVSLVSSLPDGLSSRVGKGATNFSGGQIQRIGIARALYSDPSLIIFDEPTSALDPDAEAAVTEVFKFLRRHKTLVVIAHRLTTVRDADRVMVMESGRLLTEGPLTKIRKEIPLVERYVQLSLAGPSNS